MRRSGGRVAGVFRLRLLLASRALQGIPFSLRPLFSETLDCGCFGAASKKDDVTVTYDSAGTGKVRNLGWMSKSGWLRAASD
jgi:hypothetical protein